MLLPVKQVVFTQHIGAYGVIPWKMDAKLHSLDYSWSMKAFTAMRARGAQITDIANNRYGCELTMVCSPQSKEPLIMASAAEYR